MKALLEFNDRHPVITSILGSLGSVAGALGSWYLDHRDAITDWAAHISAVGGALIFTITLAVKGIGCLQRRWARADWRRRWKRHEPADEQLSPPHHGPVAKPPVQTPGNDA